jgi:hypothetical protein
MKFIVLLATVAIVIPLRNCEGQGHDVGGSQHPPIPVCYGCLSKRPNPIFVIQYSPLNRITLGHGKSDSYKRMIRLSELPFPINESRSWKWDFKKTA